MHSLVKDNQVVKSRDFGGEEVPELSPNKGKWLPRIIEAKPSYDADTENISGSITTVTETEVTVSYEITAKTSEELAAVLAARKPPKIAKLKAEGLRRINIAMPAINDWDALALVREQWLSIAPAARQATANFQAVIDTYQAGKTAATAINAMTDVATIDAYDVTTDPGWPS